MRYVSTRGLAPTLGFEDALLAGLAPDGGLYVPQAWPVLSKAEIAGFAGKPFNEVAAHILAAFAGDALDRDTIDRLTREAYAGFQHPATCPLVQIGTNDFILELFHGPTLAFKDVAMQLLARLMDHVLSRRNERSTIVVATSGDTGGAAVDAFARRERADVFILFPNGRVSDVQRRQMTCEKASNIHAVAVNGTFDDCQRIVKEMFANTGFRDSVRLAAVNSINWARIVAQVVYFMTSAVALGAPARKVTFSVPTGNFGDVFAGWVAKQMGLPIETLIVATNVNDILARTIETGIYEVRSVLPTSSPSMDIQVSSNFERLLYEAGGKDAVAVRNMMASLKQGGRFEVPEKTLGQIRTEFAAARVDEAETARVMATTLQSSAYLLDPHTAVGVGAFNSVASNPAIPRITLATAHPAKFPEAVKRATGVHPALPPHLSDLFERTERFDVMPADTAMIERYVSARVAGKVLA